ncbi:MAG: hypothetical protein QXO71_06875 [Candidatus Jordarchaeaceae archaeon]
MKRSFRLKFLKKTRGEWFDLGNRKPQCGEIYAFGVEDMISGNWVLNVRISETGEKAVVVAVASERAGFIHNQIKRKSVVFNTCSCGKHYYHPLGISYIEGGRLHSRRIDSISDVPKEILDKFSIKRYEEVSPKSSIQLREKLVAVVEKNDVELMACLFVLEKIRPVFSYKKG